MKNEEFYIYKEKFDFPKKGELYIDNHGDIIETVGKSTESYPIVETAKSFVADERKQFADKLEILLNADYSGTNGLFSLKKDLENWLKELKK